MSFDVKPLAGGFGREICGLDMAHGIDPATAAALKATWLEHGVLLFRGIGTSPEAQLELSRCFGELEPHPIEKFRLAGYPELILLSNEDGPTGPVYDFGGENLANSVKLDTPSTNMADYRSPDGKLVIQQMIEMTKAHGGGAFEYQMLNPTTHQFQPKISYFKKIPGFDGFIGSGYYIPQTTRQ